MLSLGYVNKFLVEYDENLSFGRFNFFMFLKDVRGGVES